MSVALVGFLRRSIIPNTQLVWTLAITTVQGTIIAVPKRRNVIWQDVYFNLFFYFVKFQEMPF
jgi:hypothetical protein